ncbi:MAG: helix-turn-helix transcriptional regulator [Kofleriaceae bacterium]|nr:helix-turn-helix transcriptional regulator [Kofleriaceae bacterium]
MKQDRQLGDLATAVFEDLATTDDVWLSRIALELELHAGEGYGCLASMYGPNATSIGFGDVIGIGAPRGLAPTRVFEGTTTAPPMLTRHIYATVTCDTTSSIGPTCEQVFRQHVLDWGVRDAICLNARLGGHRGAAFLVLRPKRHRLRTRERRWFTDLASILEIAVRLRAARIDGFPRLDAPSPSPHAAELHVTDAMTRLQAAGFDIVRELYEEGRRRLVVEPVRVDPLAVLSARERAAVLALRTVTSNKEIAMLLGLTPSTVGVLLHRAAAKLRVKSRADLVAIAHG